MTKFGQKRFGNTTIGGRIFKDTALSTQYNYQTQTTQETTITDATAQTTSYVFTLNTSSETAKATDFVQNTTYSFSTLVSNDFPEIKLWGAQGIILTEDL